MQVKAHRMCCGVHACTLSVCCVLDAAKNVWWSQDSIRGIGRALGFEMRPQRPEHKAKEAVEDSAPKEAVVNLYWDEGN